jgi:hypothetical protein
MKNIKYFILGCGLFSGGSTQAKTPNLQVNRVLNG